MYKLISLGAVSFSPLSSLAHYNLENKELEKSYPWIFDKIFDTFFKSKYSPFNIKDSRYFNEKNREAFKKFKKSKFYNEWKSKFGSFLNKVDIATNNDLSKDIQEISNSSYYYEPDRLFRKYINNINYRIRNLSNNDEIENIKNEKESLPFINGTLKNGKFLYYKDLIDQIFYENNNKIPSDLMRENFGKLLNLFEEMGSIVDESNKIQFKEFLAKIKNNKFDVKDLKELYKKYPKLKDFYNNKGFEEFIKKFEDSEKYKDLFKSFQKIFNDKFKGNLSNMDINIDNILKNDDIFKKLGSNAPTMNNIQRVLTIASGFGTLLIGFFTAALAIKLFLVKSSKRTIILSSSGSIALFVTGISLLVLAFI